jgi:hypothetical protein
LLSLPGGDTVPAMSDEDIKAELDRLRAENDRLRQQQSSGRSISIKVSEKGGVSVYGLMRFPVTLYKEQWAKLLDMGDEILEFIRVNEPRLKTREAVPPRRGAAKTDEAAHDQGDDYPDERKTQIP